MTKDYAKIAKETRIEVLSMIHRAQTSHIASCFSAVDLAVVLYENVNHKEDVILWSKGWSAALTYSLLARHGFIPKEDLEKFPHAPYNALLEPGVNGVYGSGGAMGHLMPIAVGMAIARKRANEPGTVYCIMSDGELNEGTTWESAALAAQHKLDNLVVLIDVNKWQAMGKTEDVVDFEPIEEKWSAFGWEDRRANGHNYEDLEFSIFHPLVLAPRPKVIICDTIKGKGCSVMEDHLLYHYAHVDDDTLKLCLSELK